MKFYTGVGSRETPKYALDLMEKAAFWLKGEGYILRSGAARGADTAFWDGVCRYYNHHHLGELDLRPEGIYLPWDSFNGFSEDHYWGCFRTPFYHDKQIGFEARRIAERLHPAWDACGRGAKQMHARNVLQVLGDDLKTPSKFLICWAEVNRGGLQGGTAMAWNIAEEYSVPRFNLYDEKDRNKIEERLNGAK